jgi:hypothetical protein
MAAMNRNKTGFDLPLVMNLFLQLRWEIQSMRIDAQLSATKAVELSSKLLELQQETSSSSTIAFVQISQDSKDLLPVISQK